MLLAVEGGGFFSSSASGYSKGLTLLLLGQRKEEKPMRVTPWNQYQLVDQETDPDIQLATEKNRLHGCASLVCFGRATAGKESPSHPKVRPTHHQEVLVGASVCVESKDQPHLDDLAGDDNGNRNINSLKSSLKKPTNSVPVSAASGGGGFGNELETSCETDNGVTCQMERRKVQWTDTSGGELFEIREFELSEAGSDDEFDRVSQKTCSCRIM